MSIGVIISLMRGAVTEVISLVAPVLGLALLVGLVVAIFQATTSIQEQTLTFLPKRAHLKTGNPDTDFCGKLSDLANSAPETIVVAVTASSLSFFLLIKRG